MSSAQGQARVRSSQAVESRNQGDIVDPSQLQPKDDFVQYIKEYARQNPGPAALWCLGIGFVLGWKLKPW